ncbi:MAG TPA: YfhO family protein, partial [Anaerolineae bacterium]
LAGHAQMTAMTLMGLGAIALWQFISAATRRNRSHVIGLAALMLFVAFGLTAMQLLPSLEMTRYSSRADLSYEDATAYSLPPAALASIFSPLLFGRGSIDFWGPWQRVETGYLGSVPLLLLGLAFTRQRSNSTWFLAALGLSGLLIALGRYTPIYSLVHALPVLGGLRVPARFILLTDFAVAALAAMGLNRLQVERIPLRRIFCWSGVVFVLGVIGLVVAYQSVSIAERISNLLSALIAFGLATIAALVVFWRHTKSEIRNTCTALPRSVQCRCQKSEILLVALAAIELIALGSTIEVDANDPTLGYSHPALVEYLRSDPNAVRIENTSGAWQPDAALMHGLNDVGGIFNPLGLAAYETYRGGMGNRGSPLYNFLGVKYILAPKDQPPGDASFVPVFNADPSIDVYLNTQALPRAQLIDRVKVVANGEEAWAALHAPDFDPAAMAVVEGGQALSAAGGSGQRSL